MARVQANVAHRARRLGQTPRTFVNWPGVLADMARGRHGRESLTFRTRDGQRISCPNVPGARVPIYEVYAEDCYQLDWFLPATARSPLRVLDIGAHVGAFACRLAMLAPDARIHCFEPSATTARYLRDNVVANGLADRIEIVAAAVSDHAGHATFADNGGGSALNGLVAGASGDRVATQTFDDIVGRVGPVDLVKIDCEGGEYDAVLPSAPASWESVQRVVLEYHPHAEHSWPQLRDWFASAGLAVVREVSVTARQGTAWLRRSDAPAG